MGFLQKGRNWQKLGSMMLTVLLGTSLLLTGCGSKGKNGSTGSKKQILTIGSTNAPKSLSPATMLDTAGLYFMRLMYDSLLGEPAIGQFTNHLAVSFETKDKQTYTVKLNPKAKWSDGKPLTAEDVIFSLNLAANPKAQSSFTQYLKVLEGCDEMGKRIKGDTLSSVRKIDATTLEFKCNKPLDPNFVKEQIGFSVLIFPKHIYEKIEPTKIAGSPEGTKPTVFSGPYKLVKYVTNDHAELAANENYVLGKPKLEKIFYKIQNGTNMVVDLKAGKIQMSAGNIIGKIPVQDVEMLKKEKNLIVKSNKSLGVQLMEINNANPIFNKDFRLAIAHAINRKQIVDKLYKGYAYLVPTLYTEASPAYTKDVADFPYDVALAKKELAASGYDLSRTLHLIVPLGNVQREQSADIIQQNLQTLGLTVELHKMDFPTLLTHARKGDFDMLLIGFNLQADPDYQKFFQPGSPSNHSQINDQKLNEMMRDAAFEADTKKRLKEYHAIQQYMVDNMFNVPLYGEADFIIQAKDLVGGLKAYWNGSFDDVQEWYFK